MRTFGCTAAIALVGLVIWARTAELLPGEVWIAEWFAGHNNVLVHGVADGLDDGLNDWGAPVVFAALLGPILLRWGLVALVTFGAAGASTAILKVVDLVQRPRPTTDLAWGVYVRGYGGFPSGHVVYVTVLSVTLAWLAARYERNPAVRTPILLIAGSLVAVVGPARLLTNDHWAGDVVGGYLVAIVLLAIGAEAARFLPQRCLTPGLR